jgi:biotin-[acetyl-CoA-carboxylase] ligase BirA-like protein
MKNFIFVESCESTQELLKEQLKQNDSIELTVGCEHQINGRGRSDNTWKEMPGTICFSMTVSPSEKVTFTALEVSLLIQQYFAAKGEKIFVKWPNDLIAKNHKKCGGVLIQNIDNHYLAGIGVNLHSNIDLYGGVFEHQFVLDKKKWIQELSEYISTHRYLTQEEIASDWLKQCYHLNSEVRITEGNSETIGTFIGLGPHGEAILQNAEGNQHLFNGSLRLI